MQQLGSELAPEQLELKKPDTFLEVNNVILSVCLLGVCKGMSTSVEMM